jgi:hypothetical protein
MNASPKTIFVVFLVICMSLFYLQSIFDDSDHHKAEIEVRTHQVVDGGPTLEQWLYARYPESNGGAWSSSVISGCHGYMRVTWDASTRNGPVEYAWDVDLPEHMIHPDPGNDLGKQALVEFWNDGQQTTAPASQSTTAPASRPATSAPSMEPSSMPSSAPVGH